MPSRLVLLLLLWLAGTAPAWGTTYHVSTAGSNSNNGLSVGTAFRTIQHAANTAGAGDTVLVGAGTFTERLTFPTSGTSGNPIVFQGTLGAGGSWDTIIDGSTATSGWVTAPEIGAGVWKATLGSPQALMANGKTVWRIQDTAMNGATPQQAQGNGNFYLARSATATTTIATGTINAWDGIEALFGNKSNGVTYLRFRNGDNPASRNVRVAPAGGVLTVNDKDFLTIKQFKIVGGEIGINITGGSQQTIVETCYITNGDGRIVINPAAGTIIRNNTLRLDMIGMEAFPPGDRDTITYGRRVNYWQYETSKFLIGQTDVDDTSIYLAGGSTNTQILNNDIGLGVIGLFLRQTTTGTLIQGNTFHHFSDCGIYTPADYMHITVTGNLFYDADHHWRIETMHRAHDIWIYANRFHNVHYGAGNAGGKHIFMPPPQGQTVSPAKIQIYQNSFAGGGWAIDLGGTSEVSYTLPQVHVRNNVFSANSSGISSGGTAPLGSNIVGNLSNNLWNNNTIPTFLLPSNLRNAAADLTGAGLPGMNSTYYVDGDPDHGALQGTGTGGGGTTELLTVQKAGAGTGLVTSTPAGINCASACSASFPTDTVVTLTATPDSGFTFTGWSQDCSGSGTCQVTMDEAKTVTATFGGAASALLETSLGCSVASTLDAVVQGTILLLPTGVSFDGSTAALSKCASNMTYTDVLSLVSLAFPGVRPFTFAAEGVGLSANTCTDCVSIHNGTVSINESGSGWTLDDFHEGATVAAATGGTSVYTLLPSLCTKVVEGTVTAEGLWPWPMNQRIIDARVLAGHPPVDVTATVQGLLGTIPAACLTTTPTTPPPDQTTFVVAASGGSDANLCTLEAPCTCISRARSLMSTGHTLFLRGGTYSGECNRITTSTGAFPPGTSWAMPTRIAAYAGETVVLQQSAGAIITLDNPTTDRYLVLHRLTLDGQASGGNDTKGLVLRNGVHHIRWQNGTIRNTHFAGVEMVNVNNVDVLNTTIHGTTHAGAITVGGISNTLLFDNNLLHTNAGAGILAEGATLTNLTVTRNTLHTHTGPGLSLAAAPFLVANNLVYGNAVGIHVLGTSDAGTLYSNTVADNTGEEVQIEGGALNTLVTNTIAVGGIVDNGTGTVLTTNLSTDPGFVGGGSYRIASASSDAVDTGTCLPGVVDVALDGVARPQPPGGDCDIGAYEMAGTPPAPGALSATPYSSSGFLIP